MTALLTKLNLRAIVEEHFSTLVDTRKKTLPGDYLVFFVGPALPVAVMAGYAVRLTDGTIGVLSTALSILAGLLFNLLVLLHTLNMPRRGEPFDAAVERLQRQLHANV